MKNRIRDVLRALGAFAGEVLFPGRCGACGAAEGEDGLCPACRAAAVSVRARCGRCGAEVWRRGGGACRACAGRDLGVARTVVVGPYERTLRLLVRRLKYGGRASLARPLGALLAARVAAARLGADVLVPVPLDPGRERRRGFNQAELIAREIAWRTGLPVAARALARVKPTPALYGRSVAERFEVVGDAFAVAEPARIRGRRVLIVDDVLTTGATLSACAEACRKAGAVEIFAACVARRERRRMAAASA